MRIFLLLLILIFGLQSFTNADDIRDFEIEGVSVGDRLFDHISLKEFNDWEDYKFYYKDDKFVVVPCNISSKQYDQVGCTFKNTSDKDYKIYGVNGTIQFPNDISKCFKKRMRLKIFKDLLINTEFIDRGTYKHNADPTGNSKQPLLILNLKTRLHKSSCHD